MHYATGGYQVSVRAVAYYPFGLSPVNIPVKITISLQMVFLLLKLFKQNYLQITGIDY